MTGVESRYFLRTNGHPPDVSGKIYYELRTEDLP